MAKKRDVTLQVHRASFHESVSWNLGELLRKIKETEHTNQKPIEREYWRKMAVKFPSFPKTNEAIAMQIGLYEEGAKANTIQPPSQLKEYETDSISAPDQSEFLDHEMILLAKGNYLISCSLGNRAALLVQAIEELAGRAGASIPPGTLSLKIPPNRLTVDRIREIGVSKIGFDIASYLGEVDVSTGGWFGSLFSSGLKDRDIQHDEILASLSIEPRSKSRMQMGYDEEPRREWLDKAAVQAYEDEQISSYVIILRDGTVWPEKELKLKKSVKIEAQGNGYSAPHALQAMLDYLNDIEEKGLIG